MGLQDRDWYRDAIKEKSSKQNGKVLDHMDLRKISQAGKPIFSDQTYLLSRMRKIEPVKNNQARKRSVEINFLLAGVLGSAIGTAIIISVVWFLRG